MKISAATQLRSGTRRGTPPRGRAGAGGSSGWGALPQRIGQESIHQGAHDRKHPKTSLNLNLSYRRSGMSTKPGSTEASANSMDLRRSMGHSRRMVFHLMSAQGSPS